MERSRSNGGNNKSRIDDKTTSGVGLSSSRQPPNCSLDRSTTTTTTTTTTATTTTPPTKIVGDEDTGGCRENGSMDPYRELEIYLARVIEEIDDFIIPTAVTPLSRAGETDISRISSVPRSERNEVGKTFKCPEDRIGKSIEKIGNEESNEKVRENFSSPVGTICWRKNVIDDRIIDYKELLSEFGLSDSECAESFEADKSSSNVCTNGDARLNDVSVKNEHLPESMKMGITASYVLNSEYEDPKDLIIARQPMIKKIDNFPTKIDNSYPLESLEGGKDEKESLTEPQSSDYEEPFADSPETSTNLDSNDSLIVDVPNKISSLPINSERCGPTSRGRTSDCVVVSVLPKSNKIVDVGKDCEMNDRGSVECGKERRARENKTFDSCSSFATNNPASERETDRSTSINSDGNEECSKKLPPRQRQQEQRCKRTNLPRSPITQKRPRFLLHGKLAKSGLARSENSAESADTDYSEVFPSRSREFVTRSKSLENPSIPRSAPVTPTDDKRLPFSKILRKCHIPVFRESISDAVLVRVSSLPDEDLLELGSGVPINENFTINDKTVAKDSSLARNIGTASPLTLRSDVTAKRLSESDKDVSQISPVELKKFNSVRRTSVNDAAVGCDIHDTAKCLATDESAEIVRSKEKFKQEDAAAKGIGIDENNSRSGSLPISLQSLFSRLRNGSTSCCPSNLPTESFAYNNIATQTSPAMSRSSSFTWVSDCESPRAESQLDAHSIQDESALEPSSPQDTVDDDNRSSSSSQDLLQSMDEISSGSISPDTTNDRGSSPLESGIGTASPPRSTDRRPVKPSTGNKCHRKETWERIRRRPSKLSCHSERGSSDVWIRRESVHTQTRENDDQCSQEAVDSSSGLDDTLPRTKAPRPTNLPLAICITASSSLSSAELLDALPRAPSSPSAASLQLKHEPLQIELGSKSSSAPLLENKESATDTTTKPIPRQPRSQSERQLSEIEAQEACKWLRAAGFPQYAQMYEDYQFPIDVSGVAKDHPFLEADSLQSLFRRLHALNRCANMKLDTHHHSHHHSTNHDKSAPGEDSDEDTQCALSENWTFEKKTRRWSRVGDISQSNVERLQAIAGQHLQSEEESMEDRVEVQEGDDTMLDSMRYRSLPTGPIADDLSPRFRRTGSERLRDGAKAFLRRVESLKSRRRKRQNREGVVISGPQVLDVISMQRKMKDLNCVDVSPTGVLPPVSLGDLLPPSPLPRATSPLTVPSSPYHLALSGMSNVHSVSPFGDDSSSYCSDGSQGGGPTPIPTRTKLNKARRFLNRGREDQGALSDSECQPTSWRHKYLKDANSNHTKVLAYVNAHQQSAKEASTSPSKMSGGIGSRASSLNLGKDSQRYRDKFSQNQERFNEDKLSPVAKRDDKLHKSFRHERDESQFTDNKTIAKEVTVYREKSRSRSSELAGSQESSSTAPSRDSDHEEDSPRHKGNVVRWHSFQRGSLYPEPLDPLCSRAMASMSCGQLLVLRKLALLKLTACMERYCPTHRTGWNWELPKFIRKIKTPDYKDKTVFGVPLLLSLQRTGQALPKCIQIALRWLRANALDQVGIFRKSGVRSRIQKLKVMTETQGDAINFDGQQAFDVADLVKQYFRELPEALLTNKLSETFIAIFQHVPIELRPDAVQSVLLLLPDEHREALETLLDFLNHVATNSPYNQMTASNLAVCLAPSLFHFNHSNPNVTNRSSSVSPRRRKTVGIPDQRELSENKAAHDCLLYLIKMHRELFMVSSDMLTQCHFNYMEESVPVALEELGTEMKQDWRGYLYACTTALLKEAREKSRGWVTVNNPADTSVEMAYKKVGDGHPLRLWRVSTEVEAPPNELLHRVLRERHIWDPQLLKYRLVNKLDTNAEIFQYAAGNMSPLPARDYCVLRSWRNDLPKGACVVVETSVEHPDAPVMLGGTRGIVLASRYLIEPCGSGKSRIMHLSRVDTKGRTPEWYNKSYGHIAALHLSKIRNSFKHTTDGPESKV
ncbi:rho GTPase-activating protein 7 isoform X2 [Venturia canescens]|uniref:rho GTPase-activating protein 7 isoform X2 n=1 Tax=Venturia canescens TaxID=32260 RepID=UPI001C9D4BAB|nr:rho GTPase-activating protein 7 isoform X2 [Venturia canescens]